MTPSFAAAVDPAFLRVLALLERLESDSKPTPEEERSQIREWIDTAEATLGQSEQWMLAKYAMVSWIDELLMETPWEGQGFWIENPLELHYFGHQLAFNLYYEKAKQAAALPQNRDALEVFYLCVVLGYRGLYRDPTSPRSMELMGELGLPHDIESWARQTAPALRLQHDRPALGGMLKPGHGAPPLEAKRNFVSYLLWGIILATANLATFAILFW